MNEKVLRPDRPSKLWKWDDSPCEDLAAMAIENHDGKQRARPMSEVIPGWDVFSPFKEYAMDRILSEYDLKIKRWCFWLGVLGENVASNKTEWAQIQFPHRHTWRGRVLLHYVQAPESGGELVIFDEDDNVIQEVVPHAGVCAMVYDHTNHGVRAVHGDTPRIAVIAGAYEA